MITYIDIMFQTILFHSFVIYIFCDLSYEYENKSDLNNAFIQNNNKINVTQTYFENVIKQNNRYINLSNILNKNFNNFIDVRNLSISDLSNNKSSESYSSAPYALILRELLNNRNNSELNETISESRTLSSWLGLGRFRKPQLKGRPYIQGLHPPNIQRIRPIISPQIIPNFIPRPAGFPGPNDPDSLLLPSSLFEDSGINFWLKFIENGGNDDKATSEEQSARPTGNRGNTRTRRPANIAAFSASKPIEIGEKPSDGEEFSLEDDGNGNYNDEPKSSNSQSSSSHETHKFDTTPRCDKFTSEICVDDFEYPEQAIVDEIYKRREIFELMYSEVTDNAPLVDGIPRDVEESYNYEYYYNENKDPQTSSSEFGNSEGKSSSGGGFVCPSEVLYGKPKLARNKRGEWKVIVNAAEFTQTVRMEKCLKPNSKCNYISYSEFDSRCAQVHSYHRLLVFEKGKGFYIDTFRIPTACTCHLNKRVSFKPTPSASDDSQKKQRPRPALSNTLWSILGGNMPNSGSDSISQSQDLIRNQINLLQQLKNFPQLSHISPENVIQQLMDFQTNSQSLSVPHKTYQSPHNSASVAFKPQQQISGLGQSEIDYLMPAIMVNDDQTIQQQTQSQRQRPFTQIHQLPGTTTYLNPMGNGAPVVQVIHVPVTSGVASNPEPVPVYKGSQNPSFSDYSYLDANSLFYKKKPSDELFGEMPVNADNNRPLLMQMSSKTNTSLISPSRETDDYEKYSESSVSRPKNISVSDDETAKKRKITHQNTFNKKINFSYHPILEYIS